jgi:hypothetical protein
MRARCTHHCLPLSAGRNPGDANNGDVDEGYVHLPDPNAPKSIHCHMRFPFVNKNDGPSNIFRKIAATDFTGEKAFCMRERTRDSFIREIRGRLFP